MHPWESTRTETGERRGWPNYSREKLLGSLSRTRPSKQTQQQQAQGQNREAGSETIPRMRQGDCLGPCSFQEWMVCRKRAVPPPTARSFVVQESKFKGSHKKRCSIITTQRLMVSHLRASGPHVDLFGCGWDRWCWLCWTNALWLTPQPIHVRVVSLLQYFLGTVQEALGPQGSSSTNGA